MPQIIIDGKPYEYEGNHNLLQFCIDNDVEIPYFCYHPSMSAPTNCRMCLVNVGFPMKDRQTGEPILDENGVQKIGWGRKPNTSCNTPLAPDMVVQTNRTNGEIDKAQKGVLEFLLANHPLDCPICDQAGECPLQIWTYKYGPEGSRFEVSKVHKPKRIELGPHVTLDAERCINCTRCTRFTREISGSHQLSIHSRGVKNYPATAPGTTFDDPYSMNTVDICPVGALTSSDFRFKARVWEMNYTPSICTGCAKGCNIDVWVRDNEVLRLTPRHNPAVNDYWMCDEGRLDYKRFNEKRVSGIKVKGDIPVDFEEGLAQAANLLLKHKDNAVLVGSPFASFESNWALKKLAEGLGITTVYYAKQEQAGWGDEFLRKDDRSPNARACELLGFVAIGADELQAKASSADLLYMLEHDQLAAALSEAFESTTAVVHATQHFYGHEKAALLLPAATSIEAYGSYINSDNIAQMSAQAMQIRRMTPEMWMHMSKSRIDAGGVAIDNWRNPEHIIDCLPSWLMLAKIATDCGQHMPYAEYSQVLEAAKAEYEALGELKLSKKGRKQSFKHSQFEFAIGR